MDSIILEDNFEFKQKAMFTVLAFFSLSLFIQFISNFQTIENSEKPRMAFTAILGFAAFIFFVVIMLSKKGIMRKNEELFLIYTFSGKRFYSKNLHLDDKNIFTIFKKNVIQRNVYLSAGRPDLSYKDLRFDFLALDKNHLDKQAIITLNSVDAADDLKLFLEEKHLKHEVYSPNT